MRQSGINRTAGIFRESLADCGAKRKSSAQVRGDSTFSPQFGSSISVRKGEGRLHTGMIFCLGQDGLWYDVGQKVRKNMRGMHIGLALLTAGLCWAGSASASF